MNQESGTMIQETGLFFILVLDSNNPDSINLDSWIQKNTSNVNRYEV